MTLCRVSSDTFWVNKPDQRFRPQRIFQPFRTAAKETRTKGGKFRLDLTIAFLQGHQTANLFGFFFNGYKKACSVSLNIRNGRWHVFFDTLYFSHFLSATRDLACTGGRTSKTLMKCTRYIAIYFRWHSWWWRLLMTMTQLFEKLQQQNGVLFIMVASRKSKFFSDLLISIQWNGGHVGVPSQSCGCESQTLPMSTLPFVSLHLHRCRLRALHPLIKVLSKSIIQSRVGVWVE